MKSCILCWWEKGERAVVEGEREWRRARLRAGIGTVVICWVGQFVSSYHATCTPSKGMYTYNLDS